MDVAREHIARIELALAAVVVARVVAGAAPELARIIVTIAAGGWPPVVPITIVIRTVSVAAFALGTVAVVVA
jgi:hypothetical protein